MKNKTKFLLISALSLCTLSAGVTAVMASADDTQTQTAPTFTFAGTSIRLNEEAGIRFGVQMSVEDWNTYSEELAETWITISYGETTSTPIDTSNAWYTVNDKGEYVEEGYTAYQSTVVLYGVEEDFFATKFAIQAFASFKDTAKEDVDSEAFTSLTMNEVAIEYATDPKNAGNASKVEAYLPSYTVSFEGVEATQTVKYGKFAVAPETEPTKAGYTFTGWDYDFTKAVTGDVEVKAKFEKAQYTLTFGETPVTVTYGEEIGELPAIEATEYEEAYWTIDGEKITATTVWNFTEDKTAKKVIDNLLEIGFEENDVEVVFTNTAWSGGKIVEHGFDVNTESNEYKGTSVSSSVGYVTAQAYGDTGKVLVVGVGGGNDNFKVKLTDEMVAALRAGGSLSLQVKGMNSVSGADSDTQVLHLGIGSWGLEEVPDAYRSWGSEWTELTWTNDYVLNTVSALTDDGYLLLKYYNNGNGAFYLIDNITVIPATTDTTNKLCVDFSDDVEVVFTNTAWTGGQIVEHGFAVNTGSNAYKGTSVQSAVGYVSAQGYGDTGRVLVAGVGGGNGNFSIKITDEMVAAIKAGGSLSVKVKGMNTVSEADSNNQVLHLGIGSWGLEEVPDAYGAWGNEWTTLTWTSDYVLNTVNAITEDGYLLIKYYNNGNGAFYLIDDITVTPAQA